MKDPMWTLEQAVALVKLLNQANLHWNFALGGGVVNKGYSYHDLDLVAFPHKSYYQPTHKLSDTLRHFGWTMYKSSAEMLDAWEQKYIKDRKHVEIWTTAEGKRVDIIIPSITYVEGV